MRQMVTGCFDGVAVFVEADVAEDAVLDSRFEQFLGHLVAGAVGGGDGIEQDLG